MLKGLHGEDEATRDHIFSIIRRAAQAFQSQGPAQVPFASLYASAILSNVCDVFAENLEKKNLDDKSAAVVTLKTKLQIEECGNPYNIIKTVDSIFLIIITAAGPIYDVGLMVSGGEILQSVYIES